MIGPLETNAIRLRDEFNQAKENGAPNLKETGMAYGKAIDAWLNELQNDTAFSAHRPNLALTGGAATQAVEADKQAAREKWLKEKQQLTQFLGLPENHKF